MLFLICCSLQFIHKRKWHEDRAERWSRRNSPKNAKTSFTFLWPDMGHQEMLIKPQWDTASPPDCCNQKQKITRIGEDVEGLEPRSKVKWYNLCGKQFDGFPKARHWITIQVKALVAQPTLCSPMDWSLPSSPVHGFLQAHTLSIHFLLQGIFKNMGLPSLSRNLPNLGLNSLQADSHCLNHREAYIAAKFHT